MLDAEVHERGFEAARGTMRIRIVEHFPEVLRHFRIAACQEVFRSGKEIHAGIQFQIEVKGQEGDFRGQIIFRGKSARDEVEMIFFQGQMFSGCPALNIILLIPGRGGYQNKNIPRKNTDLMEIQIFTGNMVKGDLVRMIVETKRCPIDQDHESVFRS